MVTYFDVPPRCQHWDFRETVNRTPPVCILYCHTTLDSTRHLPVIGSPSPLLFFSDNEKLLSLPRKQRTSWNEISMIILKQLKDHSIFRITQGAKVVYIPTLIFPLTYMCVRVFMSLQIRSCITNFTLPQCERF